MQQAARACRGGLVAFAIFAIAVAGHLTAGGAADLASPRVLLVFVFIVAVCVGLSVIEWTPIRLILVLSVSQVLLHLAMESSVSPMSGGDSTVAPTGMSTSMGSVSLPMFLGHALAIVAGVVMLRRVEVWWRCFAALVAELIASVRIDFVATRLPIWRRPAHHAFDAQLVTAHFATPVSRRGPPLSGFSFMPLAF